MSKYCYVLVDEELLWDKRVQNTVRKLSSPDIKIEIVDLRPQDQGRIPLIHICIANIFVLNTVLRSISSWRAHAALTSGALSDQPFWAGSKASFRMLRAAYLASRKLKSRFKSNKPHMVYANDLFCAVAAIQSGIPKNIDFIYDAHELNLDRNRKTGLLRRAVIAYWENHIVKKATEVITVNSRFSTFLQKYAKAQKAIRVELNNIYPYYPAYFSEAKQQYSPRITYVGRATSGRKLELLDILAKTIDCPVYGFSCGNSPPAHLESDNWVWVQEEYLPELQKLIKHQHLFMWCCLTPVYLSYRWATPNKFFQALALGLPIIATEGTYLSEIIKQYDLGITLPDSDPDAVKILVNRMNESSIDDYQRWQNQICDFRNRLITKEISI